MSHRDPLRESIAAVAFAAAWADGEVGEDEKKALIRILQRLGFERIETISKVEAALKEPQQAPIDVSADPSVSVEIMRYAMAVMLADGLLCQGEVNFLIKLARHLGVGSATLSSLGREAERLLADAANSSEDRVQALLPELRLKLPEAIEHTPPPRQAVSEDAASRTALSRLLYQGEGFGGALEL